MKLRLETVENKLSLCLEGPFVKASPDNQDCHSGDKERAVFEAVMMLIERGHRRKQAPETGREVGAGW
jgi:hypothetical protein